MVDQKTEGQRNYDHTIYAERREGDAFNGSGETERRANCAVA